MSADAPSDAPALLLVHGFGAFGEQWRGQVKALTAAGYQVRSSVWCLTVTADAQSEAF